MDAMPTPRSSVFLTAIAAPRKDIEGLRAVAVAAVILNHIIPSCLPGGFSGVDIFFVISGYLIGKHLLEDIQEGRFSFLRFYARRARRILPALLVMIGAVWVAGWTVLNGPEFADLGKHIVAAALFCNNFLLWSQSGYFDTPSAAKPLLHLWSLGIEEQFYLLVPLLLWFGSTGRRASIRWMLRLSAVSLLLTIGYPVASFYLLDTRFWELGAGVAIGYVTLRKSSFVEDQLPSPKSRGYEVLAFAIVLMFTAALVYASNDDPWSQKKLLASSALALLFLSGVCTVQLASSVQRHDAGRRLRAAWRHRARSLQNLGAAVGVLLIGMSLVAVTSTDWPGPQTLFPVLGTALVIMAGPGALPNGLLSCRPLVFVGGISYPLYLWHWPAIVFTHMFVPSVGVMGSVVAIGAAFLAAWLTREVVENPVRFGKIGTFMVPMPRLATVFCGLLVSAIIGTVTVGQEGFASRFPPGLRAIANWSKSYEDGGYWRAGRCYFAPEATDPFSAECTPAKRAGIPQILLWGDSHAAHLYPGLANLRAHYDFGLVQWTSAGCPPSRTPLVNEARYCAERRAKAIQDLERTAPDTVLLSGAWELYLAWGSSESAILAAIEDDIAWLQRNGIRRIVLFGPGPTWDTSLAVDLFRIMRRERMEHIPERIESAAESIRQLDAAMAGRAAAAHIEYVSVLHQFCDSRGCLVLGDRNRQRPDLLFADRDHLTSSGSRFLMDAAAAQIFAPLPALSSAN
jgi:peptidoglycan/LPS O-acetylase OafA/YrhL